MNRNSSNKTDTVTVTDSDAGRGQQTGDVIPASRLRNLLRPEVLAAFDRTVFERDGYWVWEGILTDAGRKQWTASLQKLQQMNDSIIMDTDWAAIDWVQRGLPPPLQEKITTEFLASCCGGSERMHFMPGETEVYMRDHGLLGPDPALVTREFKSQGLMPEKFPAAYDDFILDVITDHPQMMDLRRKLLGDRFILDHCQMMNWSPGSSGRPWHGHHYREGQYEVEDQIGIGGAVTTEFAQQQCVRTLCYPEGAIVEDGGELAIIPGAHLYRIPYKSNGSNRTDDDSAMQKNWLPGKTHPITNKPLEIRHLSLPPGSMVSFVHHMPHHVSPRKIEASTRFGLLMAYRTPDPFASPAKWTSRAPAHWIERIEASGLLSPIARQVFEADNPLVKTDTSAEK